MVGRFRPKRPVGCCARGEAAEFHPRASVRARLGGRPSARFLPTRGPRSRRCRSRRRSAGKLISRGVRKAQGPSRQVEGGVGPLPRAPGVGRARQGWLVCAQSRHEAKHRDVHLVVRSALSAKRDCATGSPRERVSQPCDGRGASPVGDHRRLWPQRCAYSAPRTFGRSGRHAAAAAFGPRPRPRARACSCAHTPRGGGVLGCGGVPRYARVLRVAL